MLENGGKSLRGWAQREGGIVVGEGGVERMDNEVMVELGRCRTCWLMNC